MVDELKSGKFNYVERYKDSLTGKYKKVSLFNAKHNARVEKEMFIRLQKKIEEKLQTSTLLTPHAINQFLLGELQRGNSYRFVSKKLSLIKRVLKFGIQYGYLSDTLLIERLSIPKINMLVKDDFKYLERNELKSLISQLKNEGHEQEARMAQLLALTGMRFSELIAIDYSKQIDITNKLIHVTRTYHRPTDTFTSPKGGEKRTIHINNLTIELIKEQIHFNQLMTLQHNFDRNKKLLFLNTYGNPYTLVKFNEKLDNVSLESNKKITSHIFRHTFISYMVEAGVDTKLIAEHVGHTDTKMVEQIYSHFTELMNKRLKKAVDEVQIV